MRKMWLAAAISICSMKHNELCSFLFYSEQRVKNTTNYTLKERCSRLSLIHIHTKEIVSTQRKSQNQIERFLKCARFYYLIKHSKARTKLWRQRRCKPICRDGSNFPLKIMVSKMLALCYRVCGWVTKQSDACLSHLASRCWGLGTHLHCNSRSK